MKYPGNTRSTWKSLCWIGALAGLTAASAIISGCDRGHDARGGEDDGGVRATTISGAGATFPYPIYARWAHAYRKETGMRVNYQSIGSGGGIAQIKAKTVRFGASDAPLKPKELDEAGLIQWPQIMGGVVPVVNVASLNANQLKLSNQTLAAIFLGKVTKWNDKAITRANPNLDLPDSKITVVHRSDGSGTTWIYTNFLNKVSKRWKKKVGSGKAVDWPIGIGGKGNEGVANYVEQTKGSIGYVEYAYALQNKMATIKLKNQAGHYVAPRQTTFQAAASNADWHNAEGFYLVLTDEPGDKSWPITGASFILMPRTPRNPRQAKQVLEFFNWAYKNGDKAASDLDYVPVPDRVVRLVHQEWKTKLRGPEGEEIWPK